MSDDDPVVTALEPVLAKYRDSAARRESLALLKVIRLSPRLEVAEALLRGERVPRGVLDPYWRRRYGL